MIYLPTLVEYRESTIILYNTIKKTWGRSVGKWNSTYFAPMYSVRELKDPGIRVFDTPIKNQDKQIRKYLRDELDYTKTRETDIDTYGYIFQKGEAIRVKTPFGTWYGGRDNLIPTKYYTNRTEKEHCRYRYRTEEWPHLMFAVYTEATNTSYPFEYDLSVLINPKEENRYKDFEPEIDEMFLSFDVYADTYPAYRPNVTRIDTGLLRRPGTNTMQGFCFMQEFRLHPISLTETRRVRKIDIATPMKGTNKNMVVKEVIEQIYETSLIPL